MAATNPMLDVGFSKPRQTCPTLASKGKAGLFPSRHTVISTTSKPSSAARAFIFSIRMRSKPPTVDICSKTYSSFISFRYPW